MVSRLTFFLVLFLLAFRVTGQIAGSAREDSPGTYQAPPQPRLSPAQERANSIFNQAQETQQAFQQAGQNIDQAADQLGQQLQAANDEQQRRQQEAEDAEQRREQESAQERSYSQPSYPTQYQSAPPDNSQVANNPQDSAGNVPAVVNQPPVNTATNGAADQAQNTATIDTSTPSAPAQNYSSYVSPFSSLETWVMQDVHADVAAGSAGSVAVNESTDPQENDADSSESVPSFLDRASQFIAPLRENAGSIAQIAVQAAGFVRHPEQTLLDAAYNQFMQAISTQGLDPAITSDPNFQSSNQAVIDAFAPGSAEDANGLRVQAMKANQGNIDQAKANTDDLMSALSTFGED